MILRPEVPAQHDGDSERMEVAGTNDISVRAGVALRSCIARHFDATTPVAAGYQADGCVTRGAHAGKGAHAREARRDRTGGCVPGCIR